MNLYLISHIVLMLLIKLTQFSTDCAIPLVINTWPYHEATAKAWEQILKGRSYLDAFEAGCSACENLQCDETVGYGGNTDENGESTLDAQIFDGATMDMGAVGGLRRIKNAVSVARRVLEYTEHSLLVGDLATKFAVDMGFQEEFLSTNTSLKNYFDWKVHNCQPNFWRNVEPNEHNYCGPYQPMAKKSRYWIKTKFNSQNHDTIGMIVIDKDHNIVAGTSTNGPRFKIPGRVGDSPLPGAGAYADNSVGAAVATGNGDVMMRFLPSFLAVEEMRKGKTPLQAARKAVKRISDRHPRFFGAVIAVNANGEYAAACNGMEHFPLSVVNPETGNITIKLVLCKTVTSTKNNTCKNKVRDWFKWTKRRSPLLKKLEK